MRYTILLSVIFLLSFSHAGAQEIVMVQHPMIGETAPFFSVESTTGTINFPDDYIYKWKILFSHPINYMCSFPATGTRVMMCFCQVLQHSLKLRSLPVRVILLITSLTGICD